MPDASAEPQTDVEVPGRRTLFDEALALKRIREVTLVACVDFALPGVC